MSDQLSSSDRKRYQKYLDSEVEAAGVYRALTAAEKDPGRAAIFQNLVEVEMRHAAMWAGKLGMDPDSVSIGKPGFKERLLKWRASILGTRRALGMVLRLEADEINLYAADPAAVDIVEEERRHSAVLRDMALRSGHSVGGVLRAEGGHLLGPTGALRASVMGMNDGLVSNFSLVMGVAGGTDNAEIVLLAGVSGLLAGAFSMAAGEYISVRSQRDLYEHQISKEEEELREMPEAEEEELRLIYQAKGLSEEEAATVARRLMERPEMALDTMAREELGLDPDDLGSPWAAAMSSLLAFTAGAVVPILPYVLGLGRWSFSMSAVFSALALVTVGGLLAAITGRSTLYGAARMLAVGGAAAAVTYGIGNLIGGAILG